MMFILHIDHARNSIRTNDAHAYAFCCVCIQHVHTLAYGRIWYIYKQIYTNTRTDIHEILICRSGSWRSSSNIGSSGTVIKSVVCVLVGHTLGSRWNVLKIGGCVCYVKLYIHTARKDTINIRLSNTHRRQAHMGARGRALHSKVTDAAKVAEPKRQRKKTQEDGNEVIGVLCGQLFCFIASYELEWDMRGICAHIFARMYLWCTCAYVCVCANKETVITLLLQSAWSRCDTGDYLSISQVCWFVLYVSVCRHRYNVATYWSGIGDNTTASLIDMFAAAAKSSSANWPGACSICWSWSWWNLMRVWCVYASARRRCARIVCIE